MEAFLEFCLFAFMNLSEMYWPDELHIISVSNLFAYLLVGLTVFIPIVLLVFMYCNRKKWTDDDFSGKYGSYLEGYSEDRKLQGPVIFSVTIFFARRLAISLTLVYW